MTQPEHTAAVLQAVQRGFVGTTWAEVAVLEAMLATVVAEFALPLAGAFAGLASLRERHQQGAARARQLHDARPGMAALLVRVDAFEVCVVAEAVTALLAGPEALHALMGVAMPATALRWAYGGRSWRGLEA